MKPLSTQKPPATVLQSTEGFGWHACSCGTLRYARCFTIIHLQLHILIACAMILLRYDRCHKKRTEATIFSRLDSSLVFGGLLLHPRFFSLWSEPVAKLIGSPNDVHQVFHLMSVADDVEPVGREAGCQQIIGKPAAG